MFLGPTPEDAVESIGAALRSAAAGQGRLRLRTGRSGVFPSPHAPRVLWLGLDGDLDRLGRLQRRVETAIAPLGYPDPQAGTPARPFSPHLTLGRLRPEASQAERAAVGLAVAALSPGAVPFEVGDVSLMLSELSPRGARYSRLLNVPL